MPTLFGRSKKKKSHEITRVALKDMVNNQPFLSHAPRYLSPTDLSDHNSFPTKPNPVVHPLTTLQRKPLFPRSPLSFATPPWRVRARDTFHNFTCSPALLNIAIKN